MIINGITHASKDAFEGWVNQENLSRKALQDIYNGIGGPPLKRLRNRPIAVDRIWEESLKLQPKEAKGETKRSIIISMITPSGVTISQLVNATGWQPHTLRGVLSTLKSKGVVNFYATRENGSTVYRSL